MKHPQTRQGVGRGFAFILTLIFICLFACMAVAVGATAQSNMVVARNRINSEQSVAMAQGGLCLMLKNLGGVTVTATDASSMRQAIGQQLKTSLATSSMLNANNITWDAAGVHMPAAIISRGDGSSGQFNVTLQPTGGASPGTTIAITCIGSFGGAARTVTYKLNCQASPSAFDHGIAAQGGMSNSGPGVIVRGTSGHPAYGDILSGGNVALVGACSVTGNVTTVNSANTITAPVGAIQGNKVFGNSEPWPTVDPTVFKPYATNVISTNQSNCHLSNIRIPANSNITFSGASTFTGVVYIESPNKITFSGAVTITGCIVAERPSTFNLINNQIKFSSTVSSTGVDTLPADTQYDGLRNLTGTFLMAPGYQVTLTNTVNTVNGCFVCSKLLTTNTFTGTFKGPIMVLDGGTFTASNSVNITVDRSQNYSFAGVTIPQRLVCVSGSYAE